MSQVNTKEIYDVSSRSTSILDQLKVSSNSKFDVLIIGAGLAGQTAALTVAETMTVAIVCKNDVMQSASSRAQGGISAVYKEPDTIDSHIQDTLIAGAGLSNLIATQFIVENGRQAVEWLMMQNVPFTKNEDGVHLTREGGHSERRILHVDDFTGWSVQATLSKKLRQHPNISMFEAQTVVELIEGEDAMHSCAGAVLLDRNSGNMSHIFANSTIIATGGAGQIYSSATAPGASTGDGISLAWNLGCRVANLEFNQFHPTCLYDPRGEAFLISEAIRGEGGFLRLSNGERFMSKYDERQELAPRDIVSRAIFSEMKRNELEHVWLDISHKPADFVISHFPNIYEECLRRGFDMTKGPIPVKPASHYSCGGIVTNLNGRTDVDGLYAIGEAAYTGLHGANRLASNSLLECVVMGQSAAKDILLRNRKDATLSAKLFIPKNLTPNQSEAVDLAKVELRNLMWNYVGIVRTNDSLRAAMRRIDQLKAETTILYSDITTSPSLCELRSMLTVAKLSVQCAMTRKESRGCHFNSDQPNEVMKRCRPTILVPDGGAASNESRNENYLASV
jgi:L-aspartate oxidase